MAELPRAADLFPDPQSDTPAKPLPKALDLFPDQQKVELKPEEKPAVSVGGKAFLFAAEAAKPALDFLGGGLQHGAALLQKIGIPIDADKISAARADMMKNFEEFEKKSAAFYGTSKEEHPYVSGAGDIAGQLLLYSTTGPAFMGTGFGKALLASRPIIGAMITSAAQGALVEGLRSKQTKDVGSQAFYGALGAAFGAGIGAVAGAGISKFGNSITIQRFARAAQEASSNWQMDGEALTRAFQSKAAHLQLRASTEAARAGNELLRVGLLPDIHMPIPPTAPARVQAAVQKALAAEDDMKFLTSSIFRPVKTAAGSQGGAGQATFVEANKRILKVAMGDDVINAEKLYKAMTVGGRQEIQKGILYTALEKASVPGNRIKFDPTKLKEALSAPGVAKFFPGKDGELLKGFQTITGEGSNVLGHHPYLVAHGLSAMTGGLVGGVEGYKHNSAAEGAAIGFVTYLAAVTMVSKLVGSQSGRNLLAAAAHTTPGTPLAARIFTKASQMAGPALGAMPVQQMEPTPPASTNEAGPR